MVFFCPPHLFCPWMKMFPSLNHVVWPPPIHTQLPILFWHQKTSEIRKRFQFDMVTGEVHTTQDIVFGDLTVCPWILSGFWRLARNPIDSCRPSPVSKRTPPSTHIPRYSPPPTDLGIPFALSRQEKHTKNQTGRKNTKHASRIEHLRSWLDCSTQNLSTARFACFGHTHYNNLSQERYSSLTIKKLTHFFV